LTKYTWKDEEREGRGRFTTEFNGGKRSFTEEEEREEGELILNISVDILKYFL